MKISTPILKEINLALTVGLVCLLILETLWPGAVLAYLNLNFWLILWFISASIVLLRYKK
jgi:hypothetical protein